MESANYEPINKFYKKFENAKFFHIFQFEFSFCVSCLAALHCNENEKKNNLIPYINTINNIILFLVYCLHVFCDVSLVFSI